jgi:hypothetical protein
MVDSIEYTVYTQLEASASEGIQLTFSWYLEYKV